MQTTISHNDILGLLRITMLVYNYGKSFVLGKDNHEDTIETFTSRMIESGNLGFLGLDDMRKQALLTIANNSPNSKLHRFIDNKDSDLQCGVTISEDNKRICVVFRGSESSKDWMHDLQITKHTIDNKKGIKVHLGFYKQLMSVYDELILSVNELVKKYPDYTIYITGHSLGAALSALFGYMLSSKINNQVKVVSFASPRVGNYEWKVSFNNIANLEHYRVTNKRDIVTAFPLYKYYHVGKHIRLSDDTFKIFELAYIRSWYEESPFTCWSASEHDCNLYYTRMIKNPW